MTDKIYVDWKYFKDEKPDANNDVLVHCWLHGSHKNFYPNISYYTLENENFTWYEQWAYAPDNFDYENDFNFIVWPELKPGENIAPEDYEAREKIENAMKKVDNFTEELKTNKGETMTELSALDVSKVLTFFSEKIRSMPSEDLLQALNRAEDGCIEMEECEARKKELNDHTLDTLNYATSSFNNGWIPGNEPETSGWYEITLENGELDVEKYFKNDETWGTTWRGGSHKNIIAYKPITLSEPYVPPEPERELLCPMCKLKGWGEEPCRIGFHSNDSYTLYYWQCDRRECRGTNFKTEKEATENLFEIYDKLNK